MTYVRQSEIPARLDTVATPNAFPEYKSPRTPDDEDIHFQNLIVKMKELWRSKINENGVAVFDQESLQELKDFSKFLILVDVVRTSQRRLDFSYFGAGSDVVLHNGRDFTGNLIRHLIYRNLQKYRVGGHQSDITVLYECAVEEGQALEFEGNFLTPSQESHRKGPAVAKNFSNTLSNKNHVPLESHDLKRINVFVTPVSTDGLNRDFLIGLALIRDEHRN